MNIILEGKEIELIEGLTEDGKFFYVFHRITKNNKTYDVSVIVSPSKPSKIVQEQQHKQPQNNSVETNQKPPSALQKMGERYEQMPENFKLF